MAYISYQCKKYCKTCNKRLNTCRYKYRIGDKIINRVRLHFSNESIQIGDVICGICRNKVMKPKKKEIKEKENVTQIINNYKYNSSEIHFYYFYTLLIKT
jgi:hypothetical protein